MRVWSRISLICACVIALTVYLRIFERRVVFYPSKDIQFNPKGYGLDYEDLYLDTHGGIKLNAWFVPAAAARYCVLFAHGNAGNISDRLDKIKFFHDLNCSILVFDYRGYGRNKGIPSEKGIYEDTQAAYDYLVAKQIKPEQIIGYGESLGGVAVIDLAAREKFAGIIIESSFSNAEDMGKILYPLLPIWLFSIRFNSLDKIKKIAAPKLLIHSPEDEIVPYGLGRKLYEAAPGPKEFLDIRGGHNTGFFDSRVILRDKISEFIKRL